MPHRLLITTTLLISSYSLPASISLGQDFRTMTVDASQTDGRIRSFQGLNGPPTPLMPGLPSLLKQYKDLHVDQVRTHDFMGPTEIDSRYAYRDGNLSWLVSDAAQRVAVVRDGNKSTIFPDWNADPEKPESYRFAPSDKVINAIRETGADVYYRIGRSFGANTEPPANYDKFADVVKHIAMHYNQGWANGFHDQIRYWEFWNEPEFFWSGTPEQFYPLYEMTAKALKLVDPHLMVGGDASAMPHGGGPWREGLLDYCASHHVPLDFYSWHTYAFISSDAYDVVRLGKEIRQALNTHGFPKAESILSEWNLSPDFTAFEAGELQSAHNAAFIGATLSYLQDAQIDHAHFYRGDAAWMGLFDLNGGYFKPAYTFKAMSNLLETPERLTVSGTDTFGFTALAGKSIDGNTLQIMISNFARPKNYKPKMFDVPLEYRDPTVPSLLEAHPLVLLPNRTDIEYHNNAGYSLSLKNLPWSKDAFTIKRYRISSSQSMELVEDRTASGATLTISSSMPTDTIDLIVLRRQ